MRAAAVVACFLCLPAIPQGFMPAVVCPEDKPYCIVLKSAFHELTLSAKEGQGPCFRRS